MTNLADLLVILQSAPRVPTVNGPVMILDVKRTRDIDDVMARLDALVSHTPANLDGFDHPLPSITAPVDPSDGIQRGNADLEQPGDIRQLWERR